MLASLSAALARIRRLERKCGSAKVEGCENLKNIELALERIKLRLETIALVGLNIRPLLAETKLMLVEVRPYIAALLVELGNEVEKLLVEMKAWEM